MRHHAMVLLILPLLLTGNAAAHAGTDERLTNYITSFDYAARMEMKATSGELVEWLIKDEAILVDIRFSEEQAVWGFDFALKIPLPELPKRLNELPNDKIIVTACPHNDRSNIAMVYLTAQGYKGKYLTDGLRGLAEHLRGENAKAFLETMRRKYYGK